MAPLMLIPALAVLIGVSARAEDARRQLTDAAILSRDASAARDPAGAREAASRPLDGAPGHDKSVVAPGVIRGAASLPKPSGASPEPKITVPPPVEKKEGGGVSPTLMMAGAAVLGGLQGWFGAGLIGAAAGAGLGLAAAWLFHKGDYGAAFGMTAGAIIGTAFGGPLGGLIGAVVGGLLGHLFGRLFR